MIEIITIANQKGGVGKTTTAINLSASLAVAGKRVLLIDVDPQANATTGLGFSRSEYEFNIYHVLTGRKKLSQVILKTEIPTLFLAPSNIGLVGIEQEFANNDGDFKLILQKKINEVLDRYDYIIIDSPPTLGSITVNALSASDSVIIPIQCEFYALEGLSQLINTINLVKKRLNPAVEIEGILFTMYDNRTNLSNQVVEEVEKFFKDKVFKTFIPRNVRLAEAPSFGMNIFDYDSKSKGAKAYTDLAKEVIGEIDG